MELRDYQVECLNKIFDAHKIHDSALAILPTGSGKSAIMATLCKCTAGKTLVLVHLKQLLRQNAIEIQQVTGIVPALEQAENHAVLDAKVVVASVDSIARRLEKYPRGHFTKILVDEAHLQVGKRAKKVLAHFDAKICGFTATPWNKGKRALSKIYQTVAYEISLIELIKQGYLCPITVVMSPLRLDISNVRVTRGDLDEGGLTSAITPYFDAIVGEMKKFPYRKWLCFLPLIASSKEFCESLNRGGISAEHVDGANDSTVSIERFKRGQFQAICCSSLLSVGYNEPGIDGIINLRQTRSENLLAQIIGRGTRKSDDTLKADLIFLDFLWNYAEVGLVRPSFILTKDEEDRQEMQRRIETNGSADLVKAHDDAVEKRHQKLAEKLREHAKKRKRLINISEVVEGNPELESYQPELLPNPPSAAQIAVLNRHGIDADQVTDKGHASRLIDFLHDRIEKGLASQKQLALLRRMGISCDNETTFSYASWMLDQRLKKKQYVSQ